MHTKLNSCKATSQIVLRHQPELIELAAYHESINYGGFPVRIFCLGISSPFRGAFTGTAKLFHLGEPCSVMATEPVVPLRIAYNEWDIGVKHNWVWFTRVMQHPSESIPLQFDKSRSL